MLEEILKEEDMGTATVKTSPMLKTEIEKVIKAMLSSGVDESSVSLPGTSVSFLLIRRGTTSEKARESDPASFTGLEYKSGEERFLLARR